MYGRDEFRIRRSAGHPVVRCGISFGTGMLRLIAFFSGAALMGLEIVGSRVLAPYFGSSVFVWGSLIAVVLAALSLGAYTGGRLADRMPSGRPLAGMLSLSGLMALVLPWVAATVNRAVFVMELGPRGGPLLASVVLFAIPGAALGAITPFIVRMLADRVDRVGGVAGTVSALSTAGSIAGTLGTAFYLIPTMGVRLILHLIGVVLLVLAAMALWGTDKRAGENESPRQEPTRRRTG